MQKNTKIPPGNKGDQNYSDAFKSVIEFNKIIISISSTILAVLITFLVTQNFSLINWRNVISPIVLIIAIFLSLAGFGHSIPAIRSNQNNKKAITFSNYSGYVMLIGIICIFFIQKNLTDNSGNSVNEVLQKINNTSKLMGYKLQNKDIQNILKSENRYFIMYLNDSVKLKIIYSVDTNNIISWDKTDLIQGSKTNGDNGIIK